MTEEERREYEELKAELRSKPTTGGIVGEQMSAGLREQANRGEPVVPFLGDWGPRWAPEDQNVGAHNMLQGFTFNRADDVARHILRNPEMADRINQKQSDFREQHPIGAAAYEALPQMMMSGAVGQAAPVLGAGMPGAGSWYGRIGLSGLTSGASTFANSSGESDKSWSDVAFDTAYGTGIGLVTGAAGEILNQMVRGGQNAGRTMAMKKQQASVQSPTGAKWLGEADQGYKTIQKIDATVSKAGAKSLREKVTASIAKDIDTYRGPKMVNTTPKSQDIINRINALGVSDEGVDTAADFAEVARIKEIINRHLRDVNLDGQDEHVLKTVKGVLHDWLSKADKKVLSDPRVGKMLLEADKAYDIGRKVSLVEGLFQKADDEATNLFSQSGYTNAVAKRAKQLLNKIEEDPFTGNVKLGGWDDQEIEFVRKLANHGDVNTALRWLAKASPRGGLMLGLYGIAGSAGLATGGVGTAATGVLAGTTMVADELTGRAKKAHMEILRNLVARKSPMQTEIARSTLTPATPAVVGAGTGAAVNSMRRPEDLY